jgi:excisionase family DNA binding protein
VSRPPHGVLLSGSLLNTRQVADLLGLSPETVLRRWRAGELPGYRLASNVLRFAEADVRAWLEAQRSPGSDDSLATHSPYRSLADSG